MATKQKHSITVKAANPDNEIEIAALIELFSRSYDDRFPVKGVYDRRFWSSHINRRFISLLAYQGDQLCGHIAFQPERDYPRQVQITLPVADFTYLRQNKRFSSDIRAIVEELAIRQRWQSLYFFVFSSVPTMERQAHKMFGLSTTAFLPSYLTPELSPAQADEDRNNSCAIQFACKHLLQTPYTPARLYVPKKYEALINDLYLSIGQHRSFESTLENSPQPPLPADGRAIERQLFKRNSVEQIFVYPSLITGDDIEQSLQLPSEQTSQFVFVSMTDSCCPEFCQKLETYDFSFCGILPHIRGRESIAFFRNVQDPDPFSSIQPRDSRAKRLLQSIISHHHEPHDNAFDEKQAPFPNPTNEYN